MFTYFRLTQNQVRYVRDQLVYILLVTYSIPKSILVGMLHRPNSCVRTGNKTQSKGVWGFRSRHSNHHHRLSTLSPSFAIKYFKDYSLFRPHMSVLLSDTVDLFYRLLIRGEGEGETQTASLTGFE